MASKEFVFVCETSVIALSVIFNLTSSSPHKCFPSIFHFRFSSQFIDPFLCSVFLHSAFILFITVFIFPHAYEVPETLFVLY